MRKPGLEERGAGMGEGLGEEVRQEPRHGSQDCREAEGGRWHGEAGTAAPHNPRGESQGWHTRTPLADVGWLSWVESFEGPCWGFLDQIYV